MDESDDNSIYYDCMTKKKIFTKLFYLLVKNVMAYTALNSIRQHSIYYDNGVNGRGHVYYFGDIGYHVLRSHYTDNGYYCDI
jgi:hypothetical protein